MFCCPYPRDSRVEPVRVPLISRTIYSVKANADFADFFKTAIGSELEHLLSKKESKESSASKSAFAQAFASAIQSWLFFGMASEAIGTDIRYELFARPDKDDRSKSFIDARIPNWYHENLKLVWKELDKTLSTDRFDALKEDMKKKFQSAKLAVVTMDVMCLDFDDEDDTIAKVLLSVHNLLYVIAHVLDRGKITITQTNPTLSLTTKFLMRRMMANGWCAKRLNLFDTEPLFYPAMYYLSSLAPPRVHEEDHSACSAQQCQVSSGLVAPLHRTSECLCEEIAVPIEHVNNIVARGGIPLVRVTWSHMGNMMLEVVPYIPGTIYMAISHVWADRQFGSASNALPKCQLKYLEEVISTIPTDMDQWGWREWMTNWQKTTELTGEIEPPSRTYEYFWLDSFCIPQAPEHADLRSKAIESMNLIYAAASHTLVFDKALQALNGGHRPGSLAHGGRPTYYAPSDEHMLDVVGSIYASNWMGRAWTLQEGVLSGHIIFPLNGSFAYLKTLWPHWDDGDMSWGAWRDMMISWIPEVLKKEWRHSFPEKHKTKMKAKVDKRERGDAEPLRDNVRSQIYEHMKQTLQVEQYRDYARSPVSILMSELRYVANNMQADRAARFVKAHHALQSRTTTQAEDIPLILMNMSCLNANAISQEKTIEKRMKQLIYSLESLPAELLFSNCARLGSCEVDAWIPREIAKEKFEGNHTLKLGSLGFTFETKKDNHPLQFYLLSSATRAEHFRLALPSWKDDKPYVRHYDARVQQHMQDQKIHAATSMGCIVLNKSLLEEERAARFLVDRVVGDRYFLHFDCSLALKEVKDQEDTSNDEDDDDKTEQKKQKQLLMPNDEIGAVPLTGQFILHRSHESQDLSISRPQNPEQYSDRLIVIGQAITGILSLLERHLLRYLFGDENGLSTYFYILYGIYSWKKRKWVEDGLNAFVHRAWMATYQPDWDPNGPWKWFWKLSNWEPPIPFKTMMKFFCKIMFSLCFQFGAWSGVGIITFYWLPLFDREELLGMYTIGLVGKMVLGYFF